MSDAEYRPGIRLVSMIDKRLGVEVIPRYFSKFPQLANTKSRSVPRLPIGIINVDAGPRAKNLGYVFTLDRRPRDLLYGLVNGLPSFSRYVDINHRVDDNDNDCDAIVSVTVEGMIRAIDYIVNDRSLFDPNDPYVREQLEKAERLYAVNGAYDCVNSLYREMARRTADNDYLNFIVGQND